MRTGGGATVVNFAGLPPDESYMVIGNVQLVAERDEEALRRILQSVSVSGFTGTQTTPSGTPSQSTPTETVAGTPTQGGGETTATETASAIAASVEADRGLFSW
ncbi:hypothetical protein VB779_22740 [Haloarculaceae archaeon H-GB11]|nr:hypothetical protein [Haloarculaceae archaeon H-GB11]